MKKQNHILIIFLTFGMQFLMINCNAQNLFNKQYDFLKGADVFGKVSFNNNQFYIGGASWDSTFYIGNPINNSKVAIIKTDDSGNTIWKKRFGNELYNYNLTYANEISNIGNSFYFTGEYVDSLSKAKHFLFKFNYQGDSLLLKYYFENDTTIESYGNQCKISADGNLMVCGTIDSTFYGKASQMMLSKLDTNGNVIWQKGFGGGGSEDAISMDISFDKGYILGGWTRSYGGNDRDSYVVKTDSLGNFEWQKVYNTNEEDIGAVVISTSDGGYLVGTTETQFTIGSAEYSNIYFTKLDNLGNQLWRKTYGGLLRDRYLVAITEVNGNYFGLLYKYFENEIIKLNSNGDSLFYEGFHYLTTPCYEQFEHTGTIIPTNTGFAVVGHVVPYLEYLGQSQHEISQNAWLITLDSNACQLPNKPYNLSATANYVGADTLIDIAWQYNPTSPNEQFLVERYIPTTPIGTGYWRNIVNSCTFGTNGHSFLSSLSYTDTLTNQTKAQYRVLAIDTTNQLMSCHSEIVEIDLNVGIEEGFNKKEVFIYPNPSFGIFSVKTKDSSINTIEVYNISGQLTKRTNGGGVIDIRNHPKGLYIVQIKTDSGVLFRKIVYQ